MRWMKRTWRGRRGPGVLAVVVLVVCGATRAAVGDGGFAIGEARTFEAADTRTVERVEAMDAEASIAGETRAVLERLMWEPGAFEVSVEPGGGNGADARVSFASPRVEGVEGAATAHLRWYAVRGEAGELVEAPAAVLVHSLHPRMIIADAIARGLAYHGVHAFVIEMPGFGDRRVPGRAPALVALDRAVQTVAEVRRARDAIAALPAVADGPIALQGTSLGGFTAAVAGAIDDGFDPVFLVLAGADGYSVLRDGQADAARLREHARRVGYTDQRLRRLLGRVDPRHVAHRLDPQRTWLFSATGDQVVPKRNSDLLASLIGLPEAHHVHLAGDHYTVMFALPALIERMSRTIKGEWEAGVAERGS